MRRQRVYRFVVVLVLIFPGKIFSQQLSPRIAQISPHASQLFWGSSLKLSTGDFNKLIDRDEFFRVGIRLGSSVQAPSTLEFFDYSKSYLSQLGFFCQKEYQFERKTFLPLRFRLGSLAYVDKLEGKK
jgi:hypothetical protein